MTILNTKIQMIARQAIQDRLKNVGENKITNNDVNTKTKDAVDEVSLTVVNSVSGFDKYVSTLENGKKSVAESFVNTLENYIGDFAKGIVSATKDENSSEAEAKQVDDKNTTEKDSAKSIIEKDLDNVKEDAKMDKSFNIQNRIQKNVKNSYKYQTEGSEKTETLNLKGLNIKNKKLPKILEIVGNTTQQVGDATVFGKTAGISLGSTSATSNKE